MAVDLQELLLGRQAATLAIGGENFRQTIDLQTKVALNKFLIDAQALAGILDAEEAVAYPFRAGDGSGAKVFLKAGGDFCSPIVWWAKKKDRVGGRDPHFTADLFKGIFEIGPNSAH